MSAAMHLAISIANTSGDFRDPAPENLEAASKLGARLPDSLEQDMLDLIEMAPCHRFAGQAVRILRYVSKKWNVEVDIETDKLALEGFDRGAAQTMGELESIKGDGAAAIRKAGDTMVDHLSCPFPMQGQLIPLAGQELEQLGFPLL